MRSRFVRAALLAALLCAGSAAAAEKPALDHVFLIILENHDYDDAFNAELTPFLHRLAQDQGLETQYYGVSHPSLPNYIAMISGDTFGVTDDAPSCFASDLGPSQSCRHVEGETFEGKFDCLCHGIATRSEQVTLGNFRDEPAPFLNHVQGCMLGRDDMGQKRLSQGGLCIRQIGLPEGTPLCH